MRHARFVIPAALALVAAGLVPLASAAGASSTPAAPAAAAPATVTRLASVTGLQVASSATGEKLHWTDPVGAYTNVVVRRAVGRTAPASPTSGTAVATLLPGATGLVDASAAPQSVYSYAVFAMYSAGRHAAPASQEAATARSTATVVPAVSDPGSFSGTVTDAAGHPLLGVEVEAQLAQPVVQPEGSGIGIFVGIGALPHSVRTAADGTFTISHLQTASYTLCYIASTRTVTGGDSDALGYADQCPQDAVEGRAGTTTDLGTTKLAANLGGVIAGHVVDASTNAPLANVLVEPENANLLDTPRTGAGGAFRMSLPAGTYSFCFDPTFASGGSSTTGYVTDCDDADPVTVVAGQITKLTVPLSVGGALTGVVRSSVDGSPAPFVDVSAYGPDGFADTTSAADGTYTLIGLPPQRVHVCAEGFFGAPTDSAPFGFGSACTSAKPRQGKTSTVADIAVDPAGGISGTVTTTDGHPLAGVAVNVEGHRTGFGTFTGADGTYSLVGIPAGKYLVCFEASSYPAQCYLNRTDGQRPTPVIVQSATLTSGVDGALPGKAPGSVQITVQDSSSRPLVGADAVLVGRCASDNPNCFTIPVFAKPHNTVIASALTGADGTTTFTDIAPGTYAVCAFGRYATGGSSTTRYQDGCSDTTYSVVVKSGATATATVTLLDGAAITGTVTDLKGHPVAGVVAYSEFGDLGDGGGPTNPIVTGQDGTYRIEGLPGGTDEVCFDASSAVGPSSTGYVSECYRNVHHTQPTPIPVTNGVVTPDIDAQLTAGGAITGTVTGVDGAPVAGVEVQASGFDGDGGFAVTANDGTYRIIGLARGEDTVCFDPTGAEDAPPTGYVFDCYLNVTFPSQPATVSVSPGKTVTGISETLQVGAEVTGQITEGGQPLDNGEVALLERTSEGIAGEGEGLFDDTSYDFTGVPAGTYFLCAADEDSGVGACYGGVAWNGKSIPNGSTRIKVVAAQVVTIDLDLGSA